MSSTFILPDILRHVLEENSADLLSSTQAKPASETTSQPTGGAYRELSESENRPVSKMNLGGCAKVGKDLTLCVLQ